MKKLSIFLLLILPMLIFANTPYPLFVQKQLDLNEKINDNRIDKDSMLKMIKEKKHIYIETFERVLINKDHFTKDLRFFDDDIDAITKVIKRNKRLGNTLLQKQDEIKVKIYKIMNTQRKMIDDILIALNTLEYPQFVEYLNKITKKNDIYAKSFLTKNYDKILQDIKDQKKYTELKNTIHELEDIVEINSDLNKYLLFYKKRIYKLNEYADYGIIRVILKINNLTTTKTLNHAIERTGLSVVKIIMILIMSLIFFIINRYFIRAIEKTLMKKKESYAYIPYVYQNIKKHLTIGLIILNTQIALLIINNLVNIPKIDTLFVVIYCVLLTAIILKILNTIAKIKIGQIHKSKTHIKSEIINVGLKMINFMIILIGALVILYALDVDLTAILSGLGIGGLAVALASKDSLANFFGTISILASNTFSQGDWIVTDQQEGTVVEIGLRVTTIRTFDNALISIPNATIANSDIVNWSKRQLGRRIKMTIGIKYDSKGNDIKNAIEQIRNMLLVHPKIASEKTAVKRKEKLEAKMLSYEDSHGIKKTLLVYLDEFSDSSINILVYCFAKTIDWEEWLQVKEDVMHQIMQILENNNLEFAFPSLSIYNESKEEDSH